VSIVTFVAHTGYTNPTGTINTPSGSFDVGAALTNGGGVITVDTVQQYGLYRALLGDPGLMISGSTPGPPSTVDVVGPVMAHYTNSPEIGDTLTRGSDGLFHETPATAPPSAPQAAFVAQAGGGSQGGAGFGVTIPMTVVAGDLLVCAVAVFDSVSLPTPTGWTVFATETSSNNLFVVFTRVATASDPGASVNLVPGWDAAANLYVIRGYSFGPQTSSFSWANNNAVLNCVDANVNAVQMAFLGTYDSGTITSTLGTAANPTTVDNGREARVYGGIFSKTTAVSVGAGHNQTGGSPSAIFVMSVL
jgi:hypothetical protein